MAETVGCAQCGTNNPADARFCINCGASLIAVATGPTTRLGGMVCPNCGTHNLENAQFCAGCGQHLAAEPVLRSKPKGGMPAWQPQGAASMYCPVCREVTLVMADRQGIEVDYCPNCRGVWLDRGELDKIIERVAPIHPPDRGSREYREHRDDDDYRRKKRRRGLLDELFDFD